MTGFRIDFLRYRVVCLIFSVLIFAFIIAVAAYRIHTRGSAFSYSVDFTGGTQVLFGFSSPVTGAQVADILTKSGFPTPSIREFAENREIVVRTKDFASDAAGLATRMQQSLSVALPDNQVTVLQNESVGGGVGEDLRWKSIRAVLISLAILLLYIALRFWSFGFAMGAVVALAHDAIIMLGVILLLDREISINVIGAILAVLGYSINDTIVIFAAVRQQLASSSKATLHQIVNDSLNRTLRRTLLTSFATALTAGAMFVLGGEALYDFSLTLLVGIIFGTYSSIYIASPIMMLLYKKKQ